MVFQTGEVLTQRLVGETEDNLFLKRVLQFQEA